MIGEEEVRGGGANSKGEEGGVTPPLSLTGGRHGERAGPEQRGIQWEMTLLVSPWRRGCAQGGCDGLTGA